MANIPTGQNTQLRRGNVERVKYIRALRIGCTTTLEMGVDEVFFESDCLELVKGVTDTKFACPWEICTMVEDIKEWAKSKRWSFMWCGREKFCFSIRLYSA